MSSIMISRVYTPETKETILSELENTLSGIIKAISSESPTTKVMDTLPTVNDIPESMIFTITASGNEAFINYFREKFLSAGWKRVIPQHIQFDPLVTVAQKMYPGTNDNGGPNNFTRLGKHPHGPNARFVSSEENAARAASAPSLPQNNIRQKNAEAAYAGVMGSTEPAAVAAANRSAKALSAAQRPLRFLQSSILPTKTPPFAPGNVNILLEKEVVNTGGYRKTRRRQMKKRKAARRTNKNRRTH